MDLPRSRHALPRRGPGGGGLLHRDGGPGRRATGDQPAGNRPMFVPGVRGLALRYGVADENLRLVKEDQRRDALGTDVVRRKALGDACPLVEIGHHHLQQIIVIWR